MLEAAYLVEWLNQPTSGIPHGKSGRSAARSSLSGRPHHGGLALINFRCSQYKAFFSKLERMALVKLVMHSLMPCFPSNTTSRELELYERVGQSTIIQ
jgi:hypothetical protein